MTLQKIAEKILSARWYSTCMLVTAYCALPFAMLLMVYLDKMKIEFVEGFITGLGTTVLLVVKFYFDRTDRTPEANNGG